MILHLHNGSVYWYCPGCLHAHSVRVDGKGGENRNWAWDGSFSAPTLSPSVKCYEPAHTRDGVKVPERTTCHCWMKNGQIDFLADSSDHKVRGSVPMIAFPAGYGLADGTQA